jgi:hypothetical protein
VIQPVFELVKVASLATLAALIAVHWLAPPDAALVGVAALWLLVARIT